MSVRRTLDDGAILQRRKGRPPTGRIARMRDGRLQAIVVLADGTRKRHPKEGFPVGTSEAKVREMARLWSAEAQSRGLRRKQADDAEPVEVRHDVSSADAWVEAWLTDRAARGTGGDARSHWRSHIRPVLGLKPVAAWNGEDLRRFVRGLDERVRSEALSWKSAVNVWGTVSKMCRDACRSKNDALRCRESNPAADVEGPDRGVRKRKVYLYPSEAAALLSCEALPLRWRRIAAFAMYTGLRLGELRVLEWADVDVEHRVIHVHRAWDAKGKRTKGTKGGHNRRVPIEPTLLPLIEAMQADRTGPLVFPDRTSDRVLARRLRTYLARAGVERAELFKLNATHKRLSWHDLRGTCATWCAVRGDEPLRIQHRLGHTDFNTTRGYIVEAENAREGFGMPFEPLPEGLLEGISHASFARGHASPRKLVEPAGIEESGGAKCADVGDDPQRSEPTDASHVAKPRATDRVRAQSASGILGGAGDRGAGGANQADVIEAALARAIDAAAAAGRFDVVMQVVRELEARRRK